jgi:hypothetical protein
MSPRFGRSAIPPAVIVTGLEHGAELPAAMPPVETASCFQTSLFVDGSNATSRLIESAVSGGRGLPRIRDYPVGVPGFEPGTSCPPRRFRRVWLKQRFLAQPCALQPHRLFTFRM